MVKSDNSLSAFRKYLGKICKQLRKKFKSSKSRTARKSIDHIIHQMLINNFELVFFGGGGRDFPGISRTRIGKRKIFLFVNLVLLECYLGANVVNLGVLVHYLGAHAARESGGPRGSYGAGRALLSWASVQTPKTL